MGFYSCFNLTPSILNSYRNNQIEILIKFSTIVIVSYKTVFRSLSTFFCYISFIICNIFTISYFITICLFPTKYYSRRNSSIFTIQVTSYVLKIRNDTLNSIITIIIFFIFLSRELTSTPIIQVNQFFN